MLESSGEFIGDDRVELVDELVGQFGAFQAKDGKWVGPLGRGRLVMVTGRQGMGKTRSVQELFARLDDKLGDRPRFLPRRLVEDGGSAQRTRKRVALESSWVPEEGSRPAFLWLGLTCPDPQDGLQLSSSLAELDRQVKAQRAACEKYGLLKKVSVVAAKTAMAAGGFGVLTDVGQVASDARDAAGTGLDLMKEAGSLPEAVRRSRIRVVDADDGFAEGVAENLTDALKKLKVGAVIAIEDAHWGDANVLAFLNCVLEDERVMVVATAWDSDFDKQREEAREALKSGARPEVASIGALYEAGLAEFTDFVCAPELEVLPLSQQEVADLISSMDLKVDGAQLTALYERTIGNPYVLRLMLEEIAVGDVDEDGSVLLSAEEIGDEDALPADVEGLLGVKWKRLDRPVQEALALAALAGPAFERSLVKAAANAAGGGKEPWPLEPEEQLDLAQDDPIDWIREVGALLEFWEPYQYEIASDWSWPRGGPLDAARLAIAGRIVELRDDSERFGELSLPDREQLLAAHLKVAAEVRRPDPNGPAGPAESALSARVLADLLRSEGRFTDQLRIRKDAHDLASQAAAPANFEDWTYTIELARAYADVADFNKADETADPALRRLDTNEMNLALEELLRENIVTTGSDWQARGSWRAPILTKLVEVRELLFGADDERTTEARRDLAFALRDAGDRDGEVAVRRAVASECEQSFGPHDRRTLQARARLAFAIGETGRRDDAVDALRTLVADYGEAFGTTHELTFKARSWLAFSLGQAGDRETEVANRRLLVDDFVREFGLDDERTLDARSRLAFALGEAGDRNGEVKVRRELVVDYEKRFGESDERCLQARDGLAFALREAGDRQGEVRVRTELVDAYERALGKLEARTLGARSRLALALYGLGDHDGAAAELEALEADCARLFGKDDDRTLRAGARLELARNEGGETSAKLLAGEALVADYEQIFGADDERTLRAHRDQAR